MRCEMCGGYSVSAICAKCTAAMDDELDSKTDHNDPYPDDDNWNDSREEE